MIAILRPLGTLLLAIFMLMAGSGFLATLISLRLQISGASALVVGLVATAYFAGLAIGSVLAFSVVARVGHIRAFAAFVSLFSASSLSYAVALDPVFWSVLRLTEGFCMAGVFVCLESWLSTSQALYVPIIGMLVMMPFLPAAGALSDRIGRKPLWWISLGGLLLTVVPAYHLMATGPIGAIIGFLILGLLYVPQLATISATFPAMFPTQVRFAGMAIAYNVSTSIFGGTAPAFNSWAISITGDVLVPAYVMIVACLVGLLGLPFLVETAGQSLRGSSIPGRS